MGTSKTKAMKFHRDLPAHAVISLATSMDAILGHTRSTLEMEGRTSACDTSRLSIWSIADRSKFFSVLPSQPG